MKKTGTVERVVKKNWNDTALYSIIIDGEFYGMGSRRPPREVQVGGTVEFEYDKVKGRNRIDYDSLKVLSAPSTPAPAPSSEGAGRNGYWEAKDARDIAYSEGTTGSQRMIRRAGALNTAVSIVSLAFEKEVLKPPVGKVADRYDLFMNTLFKVADDVVSYIENTHNNNTEESVDEPLEEDDDVPF